MFLRGFLGHLRSFLEFSWRLGEGVGFNTTFDLTAINWLPPLPLTPHLPAQNVALAEAVVLKAYGTPSYSYHEETLVVNIMQPVGVPAQKQIGVSRIRVMDLPKDYQCRTLTPVAVSGADRASNQVSTSFTQLTRHAYRNCF